MNRVVSEWLRKADGDLRTCRRETLVTDDANLDAISFHAQQCVEKLMKAVLIAAQTDAPKTHDLVRLSRLVTDVRPAWAWEERELRELTRGAVAFRYPDSSPTESEARQALEMCERMRLPLLALLSDER